MTGWRRGRRCGRERVRETEKERRGLDSLKSVRSNNNTHQGLAMRKDEEIKKAESGMKNYFFRIIIISFKTIIYR